MKKLLLYTILLITFTTCTKQNQDAGLIRKPIASFVVKNANCKAPCSILFINTSKGTDDMTYLWEFGDGDSSRLESPQHVYQLGGDYTVQLTAKNKAGFHFVDKEVSVQADVPANFFNLCRVERITYVKVPPTKPDGKPWDDLPGNSALPELQWLVRDSTRTYMRGQELAQLVNFEQKLLPFTVPREGLSGSMRIFEKAFTLDVQDADEMGPEIIGTFKFRPIDHFPSQPDKATSAATFHSEFTLKTSDGLEIIVILSWQ